MRFDPKPFVEHYRAQNEAEFREIKKRAEAALIEARLLAERILHADPCVHAVILFGSLAEDGPRRKTFDIDLALDGGDLYKALDAVEDSDFKIDVVRLDRVSEHVRDRIKARGVFLAGARR